MSETQFYPLTGGLDQETQPLVFKPGRASAALNYEVVNGGYQRTQGYERFDGRAAPSDATFSIGTFTDGDTEFVVGQTVTGATSGASGRVLSAPVLTEGAWDGTGVGTLPLHLISGTFLNGEDLQVGGATYAVLDTPPVEASGAENATYAEYAVAAREYLRAFITEVPGTGPVRGILWFDDKMSAWRDSDDVTAVLHHSSDTGWQTVDLGTIVFYAEGAGAAIEVGDEITGSVSGATGTVRAIVLNAETAWGDDAAGVIVLDDVVGVFVPGDDLEVGGVALATTGNYGSVGRFPAGGRYEFVVHNFYGTTGFERAYGVNGVGQGFEYDGESVIPISTGMPDDKPFLVSAHKKHLFFGFPKGSVQHSALGEPRSFSALTGASEIGMGEELTVLMPNPGGTLLVGTEGNLAVLNGNDSSDWTQEALEPLSSDDTGAKRYTMQRIGQTIYLDDRGVRSITTTSALGGFRMGTFTTLIQKTIDAAKRREATPCGSCVVKAKDQYLLFFDDGSGISIYFGRKYPESMTFHYPFVVSCGPEAVTIDGRERVFVGATDGFVYELNRGPSFDGEEIEAFIELPLGHQGGPEVFKRYSKARIELEAAAGSSIGVIAEFDYGSSYQPYTHQDVFAGGGTSGRWDISNFAEFDWDVQTVNSLETYIQGMGTNISLILYSQSSTQESDILKGVTLGFIPKGKKR